MSHTISLLMTGGGAPGAAGILRCLQQDPSFHITVTDANEHAVGRYLATDFSTIPLANDENFIPSLLSICKEKKIKVILPLVTRELVPLSKHAGDFEKIGTRVLVSPTASLEIANNKSRLYEFLQWRGLPVPDFRVVETVEQFTQAVNELGYPIKPVCFNVIAADPGGADG